MTIAMATRIGCEDGDWPIPPLGRHQANRSRWPIKQAQTLINRITGSASTSVGREATKACHASQGLASAWQYDQESDGAKGMT